MPLSINVGLSRKASRNFQSMGVSINVTAELDQALLARPQELQQQINALYGYAAAALERQANATGEAESQSHPGRQLTGDDRSCGNNGNGGYRNGNGRRTNGNGGNNGSTATDSQRRAIAAIARRVDADANFESEQIIGVGLDSLTVRQASELIDHLKALQPADGRDGNGR